MADEKIVKEVKALDSEQLEKAAGGGTNTLMECSECGQTALWAGFYKGLYDCPFCSSEKTFGGKKLM